MWLNGEEIQSGHEVTQNGEYHLKVQAKKWWKEQVAELSFQIDDQPPKNPFRWKNPLAIYYLQTDFSFEKEENVTYDVQLDGRPYDVNEPVTEEGDHQLDIVARKVNGLVFEKSITFTIDNATYSRETIDLFRSYMFETGDVRIDRLIKWGKDVTVNIHGQATEIDEEVIGLYVEKLNALLPLTLRITGAEAEESQNQLDIYFVPATEFSQHGFNEAIRVGNVQVVGFAQPTAVSYYGVISKGKIVIATDTDQQQRKTTILHELVHSLGLFNHFEDDPNSILYPYNNNGITELSEKDKLMIELLYRQDLQPGMSMYEIEDRLKPRIIEQDDWSN